MASRPSVRRRPRPRLRRRAGRPRARPAAGRRPVRPLRPGAGSGSGSGQGLDPAQEALLDPAGQGVRRRAARIRRPARSGVSPRGSSSTASGLPRVSATIRSRTRSSSGERARQSRAGHGRRRCCRPGTSSCGRPRSVLVRFAGREDQPDRVPAQPPGDEAERRAPTHGPATGRRRRRRAAAARSATLGQQAQRGQPDQEPVRRRSGAQAEDGPQRLALRALAVGPRGRAAGRTADGARRRPAPSRTRPRRPAAPGSPVAASAAYSSRARLADAGLTAARTRVRLPPSRTMRIELVEGGALGTPPAELGHCPRIGMTSRA